MFRRFCLFTCAVPFLVLPLAGIAHADVSLHQGRYLGWLAPADGSSKVAVTLDLFVVKPSDPEAFPVQTALLKMGLRGLQSAEYVTEAYDGVQYDFTDGILTMGGVANDLTLTATVTGNDAGQSLIDGRFFVRSSATSGTLHLAEQIDDPAADPGTLPGAEYKPSLAGQYRGICNHQPTVVQIETGRGLVQPDGGDQHGLAAYTIHGRFATADDMGSCPAPLVCALRNYTSGTYDFFTGRLLLSDGYADDCQVSATGMTCNIHMGATTVACPLTREVTPIAAPVFFQRTEFVPTSAADLAALPAPNPPANTDLVQALAGDWSGYLHHEGNNHYQVLRLNVMAYTSTDNPHNPNLVYVSGASVLSFGATGSPEVFVQQFEPASFYLTPGFTLASPAADAFLQIDKWRQGYIHGIWYSHAFGRVGTVELKKGTTLPTISAHAQFIPSIALAYVGPHDPGGDLENAWWMSFLVPTQSASPTRSTLTFQGQFQTTDQVVLPRQAIQAGGYDFYSGAIVWMGGRGRMPYGTVSDGPTLNLFLPGEPIWDALVDDDHALYPYTPSTAP